MIQKQLVHLVWIQINKQPGKLIAYITSAVLEGFDKWVNRSLEEVCDLPEVTQSEAVKTNQLLNKNQSRRLLFLGCDVLILILGGNTVGA